MATSVQPQELELIPGIHARSPESNMRVRKRNGSYEPVQVDKIIRAVQRCAVGLTQVDPMRIAIKTIGGLYDGSTTRELDQLSIQTAASLIAEEPEYSRLAARLLVNFIEKEVAGQNIHSFSQSIEAGHRAGLISDATLEFVSANARKLNAAIDNLNSDIFEYFGMRTLYDRYLLRHPQSRQVLETPQYFYMRVACGLSYTADEAIELYELLGSLRYMTSSPTLFNSGSRRSQMSSCYLLDSPADDLVAIYDRYTDVAKLSKFAGGIGLAYHRIRSQGSLIRGTNGHSNGIVPWLKTLDSSVAAVNQGGRRKGACCVYLETWHADVLDFLELRDNTGDEQRRTHNLNLANWIPDLFMKRVEADQTWSLFDPHVAPELTDLWGEEFERAYERAEAEGRFAKQIRARDLYAKMMRALAQTGNGWMTFKDACNAKSNQTAQPENVIHSSNLCTEITEVTSQDETAVCNLGSINLARLVREGSFDFDELGRTVRTAVTFLDRVIDINFYPTEAAARSNRRWRPVGLGLMGLQDVFFQLCLPFDAEPARELSRRISEEIYYHALERSCELAEQFGPHESFAQTRAASGVLQFDLWGVAPTGRARWSALKKRIVRHGLRNSLLVAIAPTATISSICGCTECIEPQTSNLFKRETLSGEFLQINGYLVRDLKARGLWTETVREAIKESEGSVQNVPVIPDDLKLLYRTVWEIPQRSLIDMAAERGAFIDQSQSLNLFMAQPNIGKLSSMYAYAWKKGLKTTYYLRSRPATRIQRATRAVDDAATIACSLENPENCESCQ
jgi:ribonucleoside-diphosphate reductase alpha chain